MRRLQAGGDACVPRQLSHRSIDVLYSLWSSGLGPRRYNWFVCFVTMLVKCLLFDNVLFSYGGSQARAGWSRFD